MKQIKYIVFIAIMLMSGMACMAQSDELNTLWQTAEKQYTEKQYREASESYAELLQYGTSASLYYNYANALFKSGELGKAILNYERALKLDPKNEDINFNLQYANNAKTDKIEPIEPFFAQQWIRSIGRVTTANGWAYISICSFIATLILALIYLFGKHTAVRKVAFFSTLFTLLLTICSMSYAFSSKRDIEHRTDAIVLSGSVSVKSSPDDSGTEVFVIHEGTKVNIRTTVGEWIEIKIADGNLGWIPSADVEII